LYYYKKLLPILITSYLLILLSTSTVATSIIISLRSRFSLLSPNTATTQRRQYKATIQKIIGTLALQLFLFQTPPDFSCFFYHHQINSVVTITYTSHLHNPRSRGCLLSSFVIRTFWNGSQGMQRGSCSTWRRVGFAPANSAPSLPSVQLQGAPGCVVDASIGQSSRLRITSYYHITGKPLLAHTCTLDKMQQDFILKYLRCRDPPLCLPCWRVLST
jgi:hypothetical protein